MIKDPELLGMTRVQKWAKVTRKLGEHVVGSKLIRS